MKTYWKDAVPEPPFFAVIFVSVRGTNSEGYQETDDKMMEESAKQPGYLGYSSSGGENGGIFISYWLDEDSIERWRKHTGHLVAKSRAPEWYSYFHSLICEVKSHKEFEKQMVNIKN